MGLPGLSAFISEVLVLLGAWQTHPVMTALGAATAILIESGSCSGQMKRVRISR